MRVFLGLAMTSIWWKGEFNEEFLQGELRRNKKVVKELWERYSSFSSFAGWYIPYEIGDIYSRNDETRVLLTEFIAELTAFCHQTSGGKPVAISAYFSGELDPAEYGDLWKKIFASADIDIMVLQDGAGSHLLSLELAMRRFAALKRVCESEGIKLWSYLEIFDQIHGWPIDSKPREVVTADLGKVLEQIDAEEEYVDKILCFEFSRYMSPQQNEASKRLYEDYMRFYKGELKR